MTDLDTEITRIFTIIDNYGTGPEARSAMVELVQAECRRVRIDELERTPPMSPFEWGSYTDKRIANLEAGSGEGA